MSTYRLAQLFEPRSVALVGASPKERSLGRKVLANLRNGGFAGPISLINPKHPEIGGIASVPHLSALPSPPDLIVITAPAPEVPSILESAGTFGSAAAVIITAGLGHGPGSLAEQCRSIAYYHGLRIVGPNGIGVLAPYIGLNASFTVKTAQAGDLALISQSGAVVAAMIEWADAQGTGFSGIVSLGDAVDVDFGDLLDYFALDRNTRVILLYMESITNAAKFSLQPGQRRGSSRSSCSNREDTNRPPRQPRLIQCDGFGRAFYGGRGNGLRQAVSRSSIGHSHQWRRGRRFSGRSTPRPRRHGRQTFP